MLKNNFLIYILLTALCLTGCAKRGSITGGPKDTIPPIMVGSSPKNMTTNFTGSQIHIDFDEYIKIKDANKQLIISPPMDYQPTIIPAGSASKFIDIKIKDTLKPNTTYSFNFGQSITDNNEGNPYSQFKFVFSTGSYIDSLQLGGRIKDAYSRETDNFVTVMLYEADSTFNDSTIYKTKPRYVTNTLDSNTVFKLENLKSGRYYMFALKDKSSNYIYNPKSDKIAFFKDPVTVPNDTIFDMVLFQEKSKINTKRPTQESTNRYFIPYEGSVDTTVAVTVKHPVSKELIKSRITKMPDKDSLQLWIPRPITADSLHIEVREKDTVKSFYPKYKEMKAVDSLTVDAVQKGGINFRERFTLKTTTPLVAIDKSKISLVNKDSVAVPFTYKEDAFNQRVFFDFKRDENQKYAMRFLPGALTDFYDRQNDSLNYNLTTKAYADYANLNITLQNVKRWPVVVELADTKGKTYATMLSKGETQLYFETIEPSKYLLRLIYDDNGNGEWDSGSYMEKRQPEEVIYKMDERNPSVAKEIDVRANWEMEETFNAGG